jgi:hypothetical protein
MKLAGRTNARPAGDPLHFVPYTYTSRKIVSSGLQGNRIRVESRTGGGTYRATTAVVPEAEKAA